MFSDKEYFISENSSIILVEGKDKYSFIQGIISNDIEILRKKPSIYCSMLTPQGRFLYDFFISNLNDIFCIECDNSIQQELYERLLMYKLRSDVTIEVEKYSSVFLLSNDSENDLKEINHIYLEDAKKLRPDR